VPVTPAHAVAAVALSSLAPELPLLALVVGTQVPDLPMFFPALTPSYPVSHSWFWGAPVNLTYGVLLVWLCAWLRPVLTLLLPEPARRRWAVPQDPSPSPPRHRHWRTGGAVLLGAATHLLWDEFTHESGLGVGALPSLVQPWIGPVPGYKVLQYGSGVLGLLFLSGWLSRAYRRAPQYDDPSPRWREGARTLMLALILVAGPLGSWTTAFVLARQQAEPGRFLHELVYQGITMTVAITLVLCIVARVMFALPSCRSNAPSPTPVASA
jgi:Domain of unknown function (DUF4184)